MDKLHKLWLDYKAICEKKGLSLPDEQEWKRTHKNLVKEEPKREKSIPKVTEIIDDEEITFDIDLDKDYQEEQNKDNKMKYSQESVKGKLGDVITPTELLEDEEMGKVVYKIPANLKGLEPIITLEELLKLGYTEIKSKLLAELFNQHYTSINKAIHKYPKLKSDENEGAVKIKEYIEYKTVKSKKRNSIDYEKAFEKLKAKEQSETLTIQEASELTGYSTITLEIYIKKGKIKADLNRNISVSSLLEFLYKKVHKGSKAKSEKHLPKRPQSAITIETENLTQQEQNSNDLIYNQLKE